MNHKRNIRKWLRSKESKGRAQGQRSKGSNGAKEE